MTPSPAPPRPAGRLLLGLLLLAAGCPGPAAADRDAPHPRVVTPSPALAEMVFAAGGGAHLVGVSRFCEHPPACRDLPRIGGIVDPNLEAIDALSPDLILCQGRMERLAALAERRDATLERFEVETVADVLDGLERVGRLLGREDGAAAAARRLEEALARARAEAPADAPRTLLVYGRQPGDLTQVSTAGRGTFLSECLAAAGGENCVGDLPGAWPVLAPEVLHEKAPELIVELRSEPTSAETAEALRADWEAFSALPAVREGRVAVVCGDELLVPGPRLDDVVRKLARAVAGELDVGVGAEEQAGG